MKLGTTTLCKVGRKKNGVKWKEISRQSLGKSRCHLSLATQLAFGTLRRASTRIYQRADVMWIHPQNKRTENSTWWYANFAVMFPEEWRKSLTQRLGKSVTASLTATRNEKIIFRNKRK